MLIRTIRSIALDDFDITPNTTGLPGIAQFSEMVGGAVTYALYAIALGFLAAVVAWAWGARHNQPGMATGGKTVVLVCVGAAVAVGALSAIIMFFSSVGRTF